MRRGVLALLWLALPAAAAAHEQAKTPITPSILLDMSRPPVPGRDQAFDEGLREPGPPPASKPLEPVVQPDGSIRYGNTTIIIRHDCPPGSEFYEPLPRPGRRR
jgi:hypothetical protein